jgi:REP element-mobilizing transposase RayT
VISRARDARAYTVLFWNENSSVGASVLARAGPVVIFVRQVQRTYEYRRHLPHYQKDNKAIFVTFCTHHRWVLPDLARDLALKACTWGNGKRFNLFGAIVMPDHVHLVLAPLYEADSAYCIAEIMQGIKSSSAHQINRLLNRVGQVWQRESFDHVLRREEGIAAKVEYIIQNPVRAGLANAVAEYKWIWVA